MVKIGNRVGKTITYIYDRKCIVSLFKNNRLRVYYVYISIQK